MGDDGVADREEAALARLEVLLARPDRPVAAVIVEPLVQGAGGMRMCRAAFLGEVRRATREAGVLLILDEVMTGFGRTGDWFACRKAEIAPDLICLAKGLTGGFVPLAATVATEAVYEAFRGAEPDRTFWHGHSYTANPIGCAAALASLELLRENAPAFQEMESHHRAFLASLDPAAVSRRRVTGTIAAMDLRTDEATGYLNRMGDAVKALTLDRGLLLRPLGNTLYLMPPYCLSHEERTGMYRGVQALLDDVL